MPFTTLDIRTFIDFHFYADDTLFFLSIYPDDTDDFFLLSDLLHKLLRCFPRKMFPKKTQNKLLILLFLMQLEYILGKPLRLGLTTDQQHHPVVNYIITFSRNQT